MRELHNIGVELTDGTRMTTAGRLPVKTSSEGSLTLHYPGSQIVPEFNWTSKLVSDSAFSIQLLVKNTTGNSLPVEKLNIFTTTLPGEIRASMTGWEMESPSHPPLPLSQHERQLPIAKRCPGRTGAAILSEQDRIDPIPWMTQIIDEKDNSMLIGFTTAKEQTGYIVINPSNTNEITAFTAAEGIEIRPDETMTSEKLLVSFDSNPKNSLSQYAKQIARDMGAKVLKGPISGWCSWYEMYWDVTEEGIKRNVDALARNKDRVAVNYVVIDDQFDPAGKIRIGDWFAPSPKFPSGYPMLNEYIHKKGMKSVLWLAPLIASDQSELYRSNPDWFVTNEAEEPVNVKNHWGTKNYALDTTHPQAQEYLHGLMQETKRQGFDGIKIDFLYMNAIRGKRYDRKATGISALRKGLAIMAEEMEEKFVIHCGAPVLPIVGFANVNRTGPDAAAYWINPDREGTALSIKYAQRSFWSRKWTEELYRNDPDCIVARKANSQLTDAERDSWLTTIALSGVTFMGDNMDKIEPEQLEKIKYISPPVAKDKAEPLEFDSEGMVSKVQMKINRPWESWQVAALYNFQDFEKGLLFKPEEWGLDKNKQYHVFDQMEKYYVGKFSAGLALSTPSHGVNVLSVHEDKGRPQVVGSTIHLLGDADRITNESWDDNTLTISCNSGKAGDIFVCVPKNYRIEGQKNDESVLKVSVGSESERVQLRFISQASL